MACDAEKAALEVANQQYSDDVVAEDDAIQAAEDANEAYIAAQQAVVDADAARTAAVEASVAATEAADASFAGAMDAYEAVLLCERGGDDGASIPEQLRAGRRRRKS